MPDGSVRKDMQLLDDIMIQKIEAHLRGIELVSLDFGVDAEYDLMRLGEETIQFDMENYEEQAETRMDESKSLFDQQQSLLFRMKQKELDIEKALTKRNE